MKLVFSILFVLLGSNVASAFCVAVIYDPQGNPYIGRGDDYKLAYVDAVQACRNDEAAHGDASGRCGARLLRNISYTGLSCNLPTPGNPPSRF